MRAEVEKFLMDYDCPLQYTGFSILTEAILCSSKYLGEIKSNLKNIYTDVGKKYDMSRLCIERNLRTLMTAWSNKKGFHELFTETPTNAKLVISLTHLFAQNASNSRLTAPHKKFDATSSVYEVLFS